MEARRLCAVVFMLSASLAALAGCGGGSGPPQVRDVTAEQLQAMMSDGGQLLVIDLATPQAFAQRHIPGSVNLPRGDVDTWAPTLDKSWRICLVYT